MEITLVFFDKVNESIHGTLRGFILIVFLYYIDVFINYKTLNTWNYKNYLIKFLFFLFIASALAINQAKTSYESIAWGFGVGSTIYGCLIFNNMLINIQNNTDINLKKQILVYIFGVVQCILLSLLMYVLFFSGKK
jgi:hypothetical protein